MQSNHLYRAHTSAGGPNLWRGDRIWLSRAPEYWPFLQAFLLGVTEWSGNRSGAGQNRVSGSGAGAKRWAGRAYRNKYERWADILPLTLRSHALHSATTLCSKQEAQLSPRNRATRCVSWNRAKCRTNVRRIAFDNSCNRRMTFKIIQGRWKWHESIGHMILPISGVLVITCLFCAISSTGLLSLLQCSLRDCL